MELIIIGSGTAVIQPRRGPSGYVLRNREDIYLIDGGSGTLRRAAEIGISYKDIDKIFYTHLHPDHTIDLVPFLFATKHTPQFTRTKALEICGPRGFRDFYNRFTELFSRRMLEADYEIVISEFEAQRVSFASWQLETALMKHATNAIGYRFEVDNKTFVYSGDTDYCAGIVNLARHADLLLLECSFPDHMKVKGHLIPSETGKIAAEAGVKKLVLTHFYPPCDEEDMVTPCRKYFDGEVMLAEDSKRILI
ncbi:MAG TPA: MBL fold metallo-hydrolase [bacterium]